MHGRATCVAENMDSGDVRLHGAPFDFYAPSVIGDDTLYGRSPQDLSGPADDVVVVVSVAVGQCPPVDAVPGVLTQMVEEMADGACSIAVLTQRHRVPLDGDHLPLTAVLGWFNESGPPTPDEITDVVDHSMDVHPVGELGAQIADVVAAHVETGGAGGGDGDEPETDAER